jgi:hypothetical protein
MDSHPSDKNKDVRWMGHSFIHRGSETPVRDCYKRHDPRLFSGADQPKAYSPIAGGEVYDSIISHVEVRDIPGPKIGTWGTQRLYDFKLSKI